MYIYYKGSDGSVHTLGDNELAHYNHNHDALGRFARGNGSSIDQRLKNVNSKINKVDAKGSRLTKKQSKYTTKSSKYQKKANKVKRLAANPVIGLTDANRGANYVALRYEGKSIKYAHKANKLREKINNLDDRRIDLGKKRVELLEQKYPETFEPGWRDKYYDMGEGIYLIDPNKFIIQKKKK